MPADDTAAEPDDPAQLAHAQRLLASARLEDVAHGAYFAAEHGLRETAPALRRALRRVRARPTLDDAGQYAAAVLDAMVRIRADVPPEEIAPFLHGGYGAALVLLAQRPQRSAAVLLEYVEASGRGGRHEQLPPAWLAAGGLLLPARSPAFARALVQHLRLDLQVSVWDRRPVSREFEDLDESVGWLTRAGFPAVATYVLTEGSESGDALLVGRPYPVSWQRKVTPVAKGFAEVGIPVMTPRQDQVRLAWLTVLAGLAGAEVQVRSTTCLDVEWAGPQDLLERVAHARAEIEARWRALRAALVQRGLLDGDDAIDAALQVCVTVHDDRRRAEPPLPHVPSAVLKEGWGVRRSR